MSQPTQTLHQQLQQHEKSIIGDTVPNIYGSIRQLMLWASGTVHSGAR